jgi:Tn3 transposase DDE domain-containing protein
MTGLSHLSLIPALCVGGSEHIQSAGGNRGRMAAAVAAGCASPVQGRERLSGQPAEMPGMPAASGISTLAWTSQWYLCQDTLREANARLINAHYQHRLAQLWGGGTLSS